MKTRPLSPEVKRFADLMYRSIRSPVADACLQALNCGDWDTIAAMRVDPKDYSDAGEYFADAQAAALLRKLEDLPTDKTKRRAKALDNWLAGEADCFKTNERLNPYLEGLTHPSCDERILHHFVGIRKIIQSVLGKAPSLDDLAGRFGPGATFSDPAKRSTVGDKMNVSPSMTAGAYWFLIPYQETMWGRANASATPRRNVIQVRGNRFSVAPKDATKDRAIAAEPSINVYFQLALGLEVRQRLRAVGIDLNGGQHTHARVARESSITGLMATLDLSNASDTLAYALVKLLLPADWFALFNELRSFSTQFSDEDLSAMHGRFRQGKGQSAWRNLEKFSSMGNGFTFELETLIFFSIVHYVGMTLMDVDDLGTLVYGDDIICRTEIVRPVTALLNFCGFTLNKEKSFWSGPFRESCGGDFFNGQAVRPYFMKESPNEPQDYIAAANAVRQCTEEAPSGFPVYRRAWFHLLDQLPSNIRRIRGPKSLGDLVICDEEARWVVKMRHSTQYVQVYRPHRVLNAVKANLFDYDVQLAAGVYGVKMSSGRITPRDPKMTYKPGWIVSYGTSWVPENRPVLRGSHTEYSVLVNAADPV